MKKEIKKFLIIISILIIFQCLMYFFTKLIEPNYHLLESNFDYKIPFVSYFVYFYILWYLLLILVPFLLYIKDNNSFYKYFSSYFISIIICGIFFVAYPTTIIREVITDNNISSLLVKLVYYLDTPPVNCLPSMHCLFCFFFIFYTILNKNIEKKYQLGILIISILIILSTLFIKQHLLIDIVFSLIISLLCIIITKYTKLDIKFKKILDNMTKF